MVWCTRSPAEAVDGPAEAVDGPAEAVDGPGASASGAGALSALGKSLNNGEISDYISNGSEVWATFSVLFSDKFFSGPKWLPGGLSSIPNPR